MAETAPVDEQGATRALAEVRRRIVEYRKSEGGEWDDWRIQHAQTDSIENVVGGLIADAAAYLKAYEQSYQATSPLSEEIAKLKDELAESKRPFSAQMEMQNRRIIDLNGQVERLTAALEARGRGTTGGSNGPAR